MPTTAHPTLGIKNFPQACIDTLIEKTRGCRFTRALDLGCTVGRSSFELAKHVPHIDAIDLSARFIRNAINLADHGSLRYLITDEGDIQSLQHASLTKLGLAQHAARIHFSQADPCNLKSTHQDYDLIIALNLLERLYEPAAFLRHIHTRLRTWRNPPPHL